MFKIFYFCLYLMFLFPYEVGDIITANHQNMQYDICYGANLDGNGDGLFSLSEYNGDINGGDYYVIFLEMGTSW